MKDKRTIFCEILNKEVTIETERGEKIPLGNGPALVIKNKHCSYSSCNKMHLCKHTASEGYQKHGNSLIRIY